MCEVTGFPTGIRYLDIKWCEADRLFKLLPENLDHLLTIRMSSPSSPPQKKKNYIIIRFFVIIMVLKKIMEFKALTFHSY